jgi:hypothetical protein
MLLETRGRKCKCLAARVDRPLGIVRGLEQGGPVMLDIFRTMPADARRESLASYREFLIARDGAKDLDKRQLSRREEGMLRYEKPLSRIREIDRDLFKAQYKAFDPRVAIPPEMLLLLALVKVNGAEAYGVEHTYDVALRRALKSQDECELTLLCEETYHTRILLSSALSYGIDVGSPYEPPASLRVLIAAIGATPTFVARPLIFASEILGILVFTSLLEKSREVLRHDPEMRDAVEERLSEVLVDEIGHVSFNRACLGVAGIAQARVLLPIVATAMSGTIPELKALGTMSLGSGDEIAGIVSGRRIPEQVARTAFIS